VLHAFVFVVETKEMSDIHLYCLDSVILCCTDTDKTLDWPTGFVLVGCLSPETEKKSDGRLLLI
jgi:hypothetical protein